MIDVMNKWPKKRKLAIAMISPDELRILIFCFSWFNIMLCNYWQERDQDRSIHCKIKRDGVTIIIHEYLVHTKYILCVWYWMFNEKTLISKTIQIIKVTTFEIRLRPINTVRHFHECCSIQYKDTNGCF